MSEKTANNSEIIPDILGMKKEYLFRFIAGNEKSKCSLELKCLLLVLVLCIPCLVTNSLAGGFPGTLVIYFVEGYGHFVASAFTGVFAWLLIRFLKGLPQKIGNVNKIISFSKPEEDEENREPRDLWDEKIKEYKNWAKTLNSYKWYYFDTIGGAICGLIIGMYVINPTHGWVLGDPLKTLYLRAWYIFYGFFVGGCLYYIFMGYGVIRKYCRKVVPFGRIIPLDPDRTGGLRELGRLSLDLDLIVAVPSIAFPIYLLRFKLFEFLGHKVPPIDTSSEAHIAIILSVFYAVVLVFVFFAAISPAHDVMVRVKTDYLLKIHDEYKGMHEELLDKLKTEGRHIEPVEYERLTGLYKLYDRVEGMAVWPLDFRTTMRFFITSLLPLISIGITISL